MEKNSSKQQILSKLRSAKNYGTSFTQNDVPDKSNPFIVPDEDLRPAFKTALEKISGICHCVNSLQEAEQLITSIAKEKDCSTLYASSKAAEMLPSLKEILETSDAPRDINPVSISTCECLSARTGSVAVSSITSNGRQLHAFAETHIVIANNDQLFPDIPEALNYITQKYKGALPSAITFITGQSRTADIEKTLILGAHGPKELIVIIIE